MEKVANEEAVDAVMDMQRGLHIAMDHLIIHKKSTKAAEVLHELDSRMSNWIHSTKIVR